jgi:hypothetical protein
MWGRDTKWVKNQGDELHLHPSATVRIPPRISAYFSEKLSAFWRQIPAFSTENFSAFGSECRDTLPQR